MQHVLQVQDARRTVSGSDVLSRVDVDVSGGEVVGVLGPNGSGKSTLLGAVVGAVRGATARVLLDGEVLPHRGGRRARTVALVEQHALDPPLTVRDVVSLGRTPHQRRFASASDADREAVETAMRRTGTQRFADRALPSLSGGERQRVHIARALAQATPFLLLDEPTNHLDLAAQRDVLSLLGEVASTGAGILVSLHDLDHAAALCDRVAVLDGGRIVAQGAPRDVLSPQLVARVFGVPVRWATVGVRDVLVPELPQRLSEPRAAPAPT